MQKQNKTSILIAILLVVLAALSRVILYPNSFTPIFGMAVFAGATFTDKKLAFAMPLFSMLLSDVLFEVFKIAPGFWGWGMVLNYGLFALITVFAFTLKKINVINVLVYSAIAPLIFYILSNLFFFLIDNRTYHTYPQNGSGFVECYIAAWPFYIKNLMATIVYSSILFGAYYAIQNYAVKKAVA